MISFIVIGRNEEQFLEKCFESIHKAIKENRLKNTEIIYVDSNSSDCSVKIAKKQNVDKIYLLKERYNAAIGRNIGAINAAGDVFCFLDGDMELQSNFIPLVYNEIEGLKFNLVSGNAINLYYNQENKLIKEELVFKDIKKRFNKPITGGAFFIKTDLYNQIGGMDNRFRRSEDPELGLRLAKKGILLTFLPHLFIKHNTHLPDKNLFKNLIKGNWLYGNILIYKLNLFNKYTYKRMITHDSTLIILFLSLVFSCSFGLWWLMCLYILALLYRTKFSFKIEKFNRFIYLLLRDLLVLILFIPFYRKPIKTDSIKYTIVKSV